MFDSGIQLQMLESADWQLWRSLRLQALSEAPYAFCSTLADWQGPADLEERWRNRLSTVPLNLIVNLDGEAVGMVSATEIDTNGTVELISLWVAPSGRGHGVGDALIAAVIRWARDRQAGRVALGVRAANDHAIALYNRNGFMDTGEVTSEKPEGVLERRFIYDFPA